MTRHLHRDEIVQSVDRMVGRLLADENDPLALALYFWVVRTHDLILINGDGLAAWARSWTERVFVDGRVSRRWDTEVASAALAAIALRGTHALKGIGAAVCEGIGRITSDEIDRLGHKVPFGSAPYGAIVLLAAWTFNATDVDLANSTDALADLYDHTVFGGRAFGMGFAVDFFRGVGEYGRVEDVARRARIALDDPRVGYEDRVYLLQALWMAQPITGDGDLVDLSEHILKGSPGLLYIGRGAEDIPPAGTDDVTIHVSHLYRAMLLDNVLHFERLAQARSVEVFNERYRGNRAITRAAFAAYLFPFVVVWFFVAAPLVATRNAAERFWLEQQFGAMSIKDVLLFSLDLAFVILLAPCTWAVIGALWDVLIRAQIDSDRRLIDVVTTRLSQAAKRWVGWFALAFFVNVLSGFAPNGIAHILHTIMAK